MLRKLAAAIMATALFGGMVWATDYQAATVTGPITVITGDVDSIIDTGATPSTGINNYKTISGDTTLETQSALVIGLRGADWIAGTVTGDENPVFLRIGNLVMGNETTFGVSQYGSVIVDNVGGVAFNNTSAATAKLLEVRDGYVEFTNGVTFTGSGAARIVGSGAIYNGAGGDLALASQGAIRFIAENTTDARYFDLGDVVVDFAGSGSAFGYQGFLDTDNAEITMDSLDVRQGMVRIGRAGATAVVSGKTVVGGYRDAGSTVYKSGAIRIDNETEVYFDDDVTILGGGEIYAKTPDTSDRTAAVAVLGKNLAMNGYDNGAYGVDYWATIEGDPTTNSNGVPLRFEKYDAKTTSKVYLQGTLNNIKGTVDFGETIYGHMDMIVDMKSNGWRQDTVNATTPSQIVNSYLIRESSPRYGDKFTSLAVIGDVDAGTNPWATNVTVGNYTQYSGVVVGANTTYAAEELTMLGYDPALSSAATMWINGTTTVSGGIYAVSSNVTDNMTFGNGSINFVDRAILGGYDITLRNNTLAGLGQFDAVSLNINRNGLIDVDGVLSLIDITTAVAAEGDVMFAGGIIDVNTVSASSVSFRVGSSGSIKFDEDYLKDVGYMYAVSPDTPRVLVTGQNDDVIMKIPTVSFSGLFGDFSARYASSVNEYHLVKADPSGLLFDGSREDYARADAILNSRYGGKTSGGLNQMIYMSVSEGDDPTQTYDYERLYLTVNPTAQDINSFNMNFENLQHFAAGRRESEGVMNLYNGNAMNGVNMVAQSVARSHIRTSMNRSNEIRETWNMVKNTVSGGDGLAASIMNSCANRVWVGGFGLWEDADSRDGLAGYKYKSGGFVVGYDRLIGQNFIVGASFAYNRGDFEDKAAAGHDSSIDNYSFNIYGTYTHNSGFFGTLFAGYTYSDNEIREGYYTDLNKYARSHHDNHTNTWVVGGKVGYDWKPRDCFYVTPSLGLTYVNARSSSHTAFLGGNVLGHFGRMKDDALYIPIEINAGYDFIFANDSKLNVNVSAGYAYNFDEDGISGNIGLAGFENGVPYSVHSREQGHHLFNLGGGVTYSMGKWDFGVKYDYYYQKDADTHRVLGTVGFKF